jgi:hypothetical protein
MVQENSQRCLPLAAPTIIFDEASPTGPMYFVFCRLYRGSVWDLPVTTLN